MTRRWPGTGRLGRFLLVRPRVTVDGGLLLSENYLRGRQAAGLRRAAWLCQCRPGRCSLREFAAVRDRLPWPWSAARRRLLRISIRLPSDLRLGPNLMPY